MESLSPPLESSCETIPNENFHVHYSHRSPSSPIGSSEFNSTNNILPNYLQNKRLSLLVRKTRKTSGGLTSRQRCQSDIDLIGLEKVSLSPLKYQEEGSIPHILNDIAIHSDWNNHGYSASPTHTTSPGRIPVTTSDVIRCIAAAIIEEIQLSTKLQYEIPKKYLCFQSGYNIHNDTLLPVTPCITHPSTVFGFISLLIHDCQIEYDCLIISYIYLLRIMQLSSNEFRICDRNWRSVIFICLITACKVWDDFSMNNNDFGSIFENCPIQRINLLENKFLDGIKWSLLITVAEYTEVNTHLISLARKELYETKSFHNFQPLYSPSYQYNQQGMNDYDQSIELLQSMSQSISKIHVPPLNLNRSSELTTARDSNVMDNPFSQRECNTIYNEDVSPLSSRDHIIPSEDSFHKAHGFGFGNVNNNITNHREAKMERVVTLPPLQNDHEPGRAFSQDDYDFQSLSNEDTNNNQEVNIVHALIAKVSNAVQRGLRRKLKSNIACAPLS